MTPNWYSFGTVHLCKKVSARVARVFSLSLTILPISSFKASKQNFCKKKGESVSADSVSTMYRTISVVRNIVKIDRDKKGWFVLCFAETAEQIRELSITV